MLGFKIFATAARVIAEIELIHHIRENQFRLTRIPGPTPRLPMPVVWNITLA